MFFNNDIHGKAIEKLLNHLIGFVHLILDHLEFPFEETITY
jgi:hypothetical protein